MSDSVLIVGSFVYVAAVTAVALLISKKTGLFLARKVVHILVSLWIIIAFEIESPVLRLMGPVLFIFINIYPARKFSHIGMVLFPAAIALMLSLNIAGVFSQTSVVSATLVMGVSDGVAGITGGILKKSNKSAEGAISMFISAFIIFVAVGFSIPAGVAVAFAATVVEFISPGTVDNISVPIITAVLAEALCVL